MIDLDTTTRQSLSVHEVRELLGKSTRTIYYWIESGKLPAVPGEFGTRIPIGAVRVLASYLQQHQLLRHAIRPRVITSCAKSA